MKKVILNYAHAVGMHHYGSRQLPIEVVYKLKHEPNNPHDPNAIAIVDHESGRKVAYLSRWFAAYVSRIFLSGLLVGSIFLKAKFPAEVRKRHVGPEQKVALAFRCDEEQIEEIKKLLGGSCLSIQIK